MRKLTVQHSYYCPFCGHQVALETFDEEHLVCPECGVMLERQLLDGSKLRVEVRGRRDAVQKIAEKAIAMDLTERRLQVARELVKELPNISRKEKEILIDHIGALLKETSTTAQSAKTTKRILSKTSKEAATILRGVFIDLVSETAKKILWPQKP